MPRLHAPCCVMGHLLCEGPPALLCFGPLLRLHFPVLLPVQFPLYSGQIRALHDSIPSSVTTISICHQSE